MKNKNRFKNNNNKNLKSHHFFKGDGVDDIGKYT